MLGMNPCMQTRFLWGRREIAAQVLVEPPAQNVSHMDFSLGLGLRDQQRKKFM